MNAHRFDGKIAIVLGSATGIGAQTARQLAQEGAIVTLADINEQGARQLADEITSAGGSAVFRYANLYDEASIAAMVEATVAEHGRVDCLFNNAADLSLVFNDFDVVSTDLANFDRTIQANMRGFVLSCRSVIPHMEQHGGSIVQTSSLAGQFGGGDVGRCAYGMAKAAIDSLMRHVAARWGKIGIRCNNVAPGLTRTEVFQQMEAAMGLEQALVMIGSPTMLHDTPYPRLGLATDIANTVTFLLSDDASFINGQVIRVDGGISAVMNVAQPPTT